MFVHTLGSREIDALYEGFFYIYKRTPTFNIAIYQLNVIKSPWNTKHLLFTTYECPRGEAHMDN